MTASDARPHTWLPLQLANFMEELETSGLLKDDVAATEHDTQDRQPADSAASSPPGVVATPAAPMAPSHSSLAAAAASASAVLASEQHDVEADGHAGPQSESPDQDTEEAEQRVLGSLTGCPGWHEVMDMASGKV